MKKRCQLITNSIAAQRQLPVSILDVRGFRIGDERQSLIIITKTETLLCDAPAAEGDAGDHVTDALVRWQSG